ncbi:pilin [Streptomyces armeniacus]|uniref:pilin n=1 Tax=Streptomyces armeniacus TaxID=83291 RepID=UPI001C9B1E2C
MRRLAVRVLVAGGTGAVLLLAEARPAWALATVPEVISNLRNWIVGISAGLATLFLTLGGARYLMASGDPGEVEAAKRALKAAAIGYGIAVLAPVITEVLQGIIGAEGNGGS